MASSKTTAAERVDQDSREGRAGRETRVVVLSSAKGGSGKTTTTRNLAVYAVQTGLAVGTVDLDAQASLTSWFQRRPVEAPEIHHFQVPFDEAITALDAIVAEGRLDILFVDTPPGVDANPSTVRGLLRRADLTLVPTGQGAPDLETVTEWARFIRREGRRFAFVLNRTARAKNSFGEAKLELSRAGPLCPFDVRDLEDIQRTHRNGLGVAEVRGAMGTSDLEGVWNFVRLELGMGYAD